MTLKQTGLALSLIAMGACSSGRNSKAETASVPGANGHLFPPSEGAWKTSAGLEYYYNGPAERHFCVLVKDENNPPRFLAVFESELTEKILSNAGKCLPVSGDFPPTEGWWRTSKGIGYYFSGPAKKGFCLLSTDNKPLRFSGVFDPVIDLNGPSVAKCGPDSNASADKQRASNPPQRGWWQTSDGIAYYYAGDVSCVFSVRNEADQSLYDTKVNKQLIGVWDPLINVQGLGRCFPYGR